MEQVAQHPEEYEAVFLSEDTETWTIELLPLSEEPLFHQGVIYVRKERCTIVRAEFFDAEGILVEEDRITEHTELVNASGASILYPSRLEIHDVEEDKITRISYLSLEFPDSIEETRFSLEAIQELSRQVLEGKL